MQKKLTKLQAYNVMIIFLESFFLRNRSEDIGDLLSDSEFFWDGKTTADPASWFKWKQALIVTMKEDSKILDENRLTVFQAFHAMLNYLKIYRSLWGKTDDLDALIQEIHFLYETYNIKNVMWQEWFKVAAQVGRMKDPRVQKQLI